MDKKSNFKYFLDWLTGENLFIIGLIIVVILAMILSLYSDAKAECLVHTVKSGDTLGKISQQYYGDRNHWQDIKWQNNLDNTYIKKDQKLGIYIPTSDWRIACRALLSMRLDRLHLNRSDKFKDDFVAGIEDMNIGTNPRKALEECRLAITTAHQESMFEFAIGGAGEVGIYQYKLNTVRLTGRWHSIDHLQGTDEELVRLLLNTREATKVFILHYRELYKRYKGYWLAWKYYNNGGEAAAYASRAVKRYWEVRRLQSIKCPLETE